jgi:hypothetical protein
VLLRPVEWFHHALGGHISRRSMRCHPDCKLVSVHTVHYMHGLADIAAGWDLDLRRIVNVILGHRVQDLFRELNKRDEPQKVSQAGFPKVGKSPSPPLFSLESFLRFFFFMGGFLAVPSVAARCTAGRDKGRKDEPCP